MPRKLIELTDEQVAQIEALAAYLNQEQIADHFSFTRQTFNNIKERDERVDQAYRRGRAKAVANVGKGLLQKAEGGDLGAMCFYLKTQAGWAEKQKLEHTGEDGGPIAIKTIERRIIDPNA